MAARLNRLHSDAVRAKIQASQLINSLTNHVLGEKELSATQVRAAEILLKKSIPDLSSIEHSGEIDGKQEHTHKLDAKSLSTQTLKELLAARESN